MYTRVLSVGANCNKGMCARCVCARAHWAPENWPTHYKDTKHDIQKMIKDIEKGKKLVLKELCELSEVQLEEDTSYWGGTRKQKEGLFAYLAEIAHHKGQIAYIRGTYARQHGKKWKYP